MTTTVDFPGLGLETELDRVAFSIGDFPIYWYGIIIGIGVALAMVWAFWKSREFGVDADKFIDAVIIGALMGIFGARLFYVLFAEPGQFNTIGDFFDFRNGGLVFYGALIFGMLAAYIISRWRRIKFLPMADLVAVGFMIGQSVGRWGNYVNQEAFGTNTDLPWGMFSSYTKSYLQNHQMDLLEKGIVVDPNLPVHPTFLYESLWLLIGFILLSFYIKHRKFDGEVLLLYVAWNGVGRAFIEGLRTDSMYLGSIRVSQLLAVLGVAVAIPVIVWIRVKIKKSGEDNYLIPYAYTDAWAREYAAIVERRVSTSAKATTEKATKAKEPSKDNAQATAKTAATEKPVAVASETVAETAAASGKKPKKEKKLAADAALAAESESKPAKPKAAETQAAQAKDTAEKSEAAETKTAETAVEQPKAATAEAVDAKADEAKESKAAQTKPAKSKTTPSKTEKVKTDKSAAAKKADAQKQAKPDKQPATPKKAKPADETKDSTSSKANKPEKDYDDQNLPTGEKEAAPQTQTAASAKAEKPLEEKKQIKPKKVKREILDDLDAKDNNKEKTDEKVADKDAETIAANKTTKAKAGQKEEAPQSVPEDSATDDKH